MGMGIKKLFKRVKMKNNNPKILEVIADWLSTRGYDLQDFLSILKMVGIKTPVKLQSLCFERDEFTCIDKTRTYYNILLYREGNLEKIKIWTRNDKREYILNQKVPKSDEPNLIFRKRVYIKDDVTLTSENTIECSKKILEVKGKKVVIISCEKAEMDTGQAHKIDFSIWDRVDEYLINLNFEKGIKTSELKKVLNERFLCTKISNIEIRECS